MRLGLNGSVALITGATSGIGLATARTMVAEGVRVITVSRATEGPKVGETRHIAADLFRRGEPERVIRSTESALGRIDILVNNVGYAVISSLEELDDHDWEVMLRANVLATIGATSAVLPGMLDRRRGSIINIASTAGRRPSVKLPAYSVTKAALLAYSQQVALTYARDGVRCNAVISGPTLTRSWLEPGGLAEQQGGPAAFSQFFNQTKHLASPGRLSDKYVASFFKVRKHVDS